MIAPIDVTKELAKRIKVSTDTASRILKLHEKASESQREKLRKNEYRKRRSKEAVQERASKGGKAKAGYLSDTVFDKQDFYKATSISYNISERKLRYVNYLKSGSVQKSVVF